MEGRAARADDEQHAGEPATMASQRCQSSGAPSVRREQRDQQRHRELDRAGLGEP